VGDTQCAGGFHDAALVASGMLESSRGLFIPTQQQREFIESRSEEWNRAIARVSSMLTYQPESRRGVDVTCRPWPSHIDCCTVGRSTNLNARLHFTALTTPSAPTQQPHHPAQSRRLAPQVHRWVTNWVMAEVRGPA